MLDGVARSYVLFGVALFGALLLGGIAIRLVFFPIDTNPSHAFGCFESATAGVVEVGPNGLRLDGGDGRFFVPFDLKYSRSYKLAIDGSVGLVSDGQGYRWEELSRGWSQLMPFDGEPGIFSVHETDPTKLDRFSVFVTGAQKKVSFTRTDPSRCAAN